MYDTQVFPFEYGSLDAQDCVAYYQQALGFGVLEYRRCWNIMVWWDIVGW